MSVSIIIPAYNAAETVGDTLRSVLSQSYSDWEVLLVDDGSTDTTVDVAERTAAGDRRVHILRRPNGGVSAARNAGIEQAHGDWLLFLDADDTLHPDHLERLTTALRNDPTVDAIHCGWAMVTADGVQLPGQFGPADPDMFEAMARRCVFAIHACLVRRSLATAVGGFDPDLRTCEDWDFWQRVARTGARFAALREVLALYKLRPESASRSGRQMVQDGLRVAARVHGPDPRVIDAHPNHRDGLPAEQYPATMYFVVTTGAALELGCGRDARPLLAYCQDGIEPGLDPDAIAATLFDAALLPFDHAHSTWLNTWPRMQRHVEDYLTALEERSRAFGLCHRTILRLQRRILTASPQRSMTLGPFYAMDLEVTEPLHDISVEESVERVLCTVRIRGEALGTLELPAFDGFLSKYVLEDAVAAQFAWQILGRYLAIAVYPSLESRDEAGIQSLFRGKTCIIEGMSSRDDHYSAELHDEIGWLLFLQALWDRPEWSNNEFYNMDTPEPQPTKEVRSGHRILIDVSDDLPDVKVGGEQLDVMFTVGGLPLERCVIRAERGLVRAQELRVTALHTGGYELCRVAVREGVLGRPLTATTSLRAQIAQRAQQRNSHMLVDDLPATPELYRAAIDMLGICPGTPGSALLLGRRKGQPLGTSASRRAMLRAMSGHPNPIPPDEYAAQLHADTVRASLWATYAPEIIHAGMDDPEDNRVGVGLDSYAPITEQHNAYDRHAFESLFASEADPWRYTSTYEQTKYDQTIELLPHTRIHRALELACAEGHFTRQLAPLVDSLIAADISELALAHAAERCKDIHNVQYARIDIVSDELPANLDLIVCSEVLYFVGQIHVLKAVAQKFARALAPGGYLLMAHANLVIDEPDQPGFDWGDLPFGGKVISDTFQQESSLQLEREIRTPLYRVQLYRRVKRPLFWPGKRRPATVDYREQTELTPRVEKYVRWAGSGVARVHQQAVTTSRLPILMYHRVAETGSRVLSRYRVSPAQFETQLRYLRDAGFYSVGPEQWYRAITDRRPLPGRAVMLTFDDGYVDFAEQAWPLLEHYGFSATVFIVSEEAGKRNVWDAAFGEQVQLMDWDTIRALQREGVEFGSHAATHRPLTALSIAEISAELLQSRAVLGQELGHLVTTVAYPYGDFDPAIAHLAGASGYLAGFTCGGTLSTLRDSLMTLPRIEVSGNDDLPSFIRKLAV